MLDSREECPHGLICVGPHDASIAKRSRQDGRQLALGVSHEFLIETSHVVPRRPGGDLEANRLSGLFQREADSTDGTDQVLHVGSTDPQPVPVGRVHSDECARQKLPPSQLLAEQVVMQLRHALHESPTFRLEKESLDHLFLDWSDRRHGRHFL